MLSELLSGMFGFRKSREPFQGEVWYVYRINPDGSCVALYTLDSSEKAKAMKMAQIRAVLNHALALYSPDWVLSETEFDALMAAPEFRQGYQLVDLAAFALSKHEVDLDSLTPVGVFAKDSSYPERVSVLNRPYLPLSGAQASDLDALCWDVYQMPGGLFVTFGDAGHPYHPAKKALMPLNDLSLVRQSK